jgi:hypothetical protein
VLIGSTPTPAGDGSILIGPTPTPAAVGVVGTSYVSPTFRYALSWDPGWSVVDERSDGGTDVLWLTNGVSEIGFTASSAHDGDPAACLEFLSGELAADPSRSDVQPASDTEGQPVRGGDAARAYAVFLSTRQGQDGQPVGFATYLDCRVLIPGQAVLKIVQHVPVDAFNEQAPAREALLAGLVLPPRARSSLLPRRRRRRSPPRRTMGRSFARISRGPGRRRVPVRLACRCSSGPSTPAAVRSSRPPPSSVVPSTSARPTAPFTPSTR